MVIEIGDKRLTYEDVVKVARHNEIVRLSDSAKNKIKKRCRIYLHLFLIYRIAKLFFNPLYSTKSHFTEPIIKSN